MGRHDLMEYVKAFEGTHDLMVIMADHDSLMIYDFLRN